MNLYQLSQVSDEERDSNWEVQFLQALSEGQVRVLSPDPIQGPDQWPYLFAETSENATEPAQKVLAWLSTRGLGLVINPQKERPDYVFTYGMIWSFRETGYFFKNTGTVLTSALEFDAKAIVHAGTPNEAYLPSYVRNILREFFKNQGIFTPKALLLSQDKRHYDLAISLESLGNPAIEEHGGIAEAISWFLPPHYSILLVSQKGLPEFAEI